MLCGMPRRRCQDRPIFERIAENAAPGKGRVRGGTMRCAEATVPRPASFERFLGGNGGCAAKPVAGRAKGVV